MPCRVAGALNNTNDAKYIRHRPEQGLLYRIIETFWPIFLREQGRVGKTLPPFIKDEFKKFLNCGIPELGFIRTYCCACRFSSIVAFSCKKRGFCPSCTARRMNDEAAHLVDHVLPAVKVRQWVLSFPYNLRFLMAHNLKLTNQILSIFINVVNAYQKKQARKRGVQSARPGSVTFIQRFGSALNLNVHFHTLFVDGVYYKSNSGYRFLKLSPPTHDELFLLAQKVQSKVLRLVERLGLNESEQTNFNENALGELAAHSIRQKVAFGKMSGNNLLRYGIENFEIKTHKNDPYSANVGGFSLNARVWISGRKKTKLEKLIRYMARGPIAAERLSEHYPNQLLYKMKTPWRDGTTHVSFSPLDFIARLVALIPPQKMNMVRYHGVFASNFKDRNQIVPKSKEPPKVTPLNSADGPRAEKRARRERMRWADMLKRTFKIDVTVCAGCNGRLEQIAVIKDRVVARAILASLNETTVFRPLEIVRGRGPPDGEFESKNEFDQRESW